MGPPRTNGRTFEETLVVIVTFADGHHETARFPYPWTYPDGERTDPWSATNIRGNTTGTVGVLVQQPPRGSDISTFPPLVQFVLAQTDRNGYAHLPFCPSYGTPPRYPDPSGITFIDDSPPDSPVTLDDPRSYTLGCLGFRNRTARTLTIVHFTLTKVDATGRQGPPEHFDRFGSFAPGVLIGGYPRGMSWGRTSNNMLRNCDRGFSLGPSDRVLRIGVTGATYADETTWTPHATVAPSP